jgi:hypothetical protein
MHERRVLSVVNAATVRNPVFKPISLSFFKKNKTLYNSSDTKHWGHKAADRQESYPVSMLVIRIHACSHALCWLQAPYQKANYLNRLLSDAHLGMLYIKQIYLQSIESQYLSLCRKLRVDKAVQGGSILLLKVVHVITYPQPPMLQEVVKASRIYCVPHCLRATRLVK